MLSMLSENPNSMTSYDYDSIVLAYECDRPKIKHKYS